jgi:inner membrane protein COX18
VDRSTRGYSAVSTSDTTPTFWLISPDALPVQAAQTFYETLHHWVPLPWWAIIVGSTLFLRGTITVPLAVHQNRMISKMILMGPTMKEYSEAILHNVVVRCRRAGLPASEANRQYRLEVKKMRRELYRKQGFSPVRVAILPWVQIPLWITLSLGLRNVCGAYPGADPSCIDSSLHSEGFLWVPDLTMTDSWWILPVILGLCNWLNIELHSLKKLSKGNHGSRIITNILRVMSIGMIYIATHVPSAMCLYWATSSCIGLAQTILFQFPKVRRILKFPKTPNDSEKPFKDLMTMFQLQAKQFIERKV